ENAQLSATPRMVTVCAPARPTWRPKKPATIAPSSGASTMISRWVVEIAMSGPLPVYVCRPVRLPRRASRWRPAAARAPVPAATRPALPRPGVRPASPSSLQRVDLGDVDRAAVAEQRHQDGQADRGLGRGHREDEEHEDLPRLVAEVPRERDEVDVHRQQHQLDRHQQDDDVLAVEENAGHADAEQHRAQRQVVSSSRALSGELHCCRASPPVASSPCFSAGMLTMRRRSAARTRACSAGFWCLVPGRRRRVSATAAITATVRISAATSNGSRKSVNRRRATQATLLPPDASTASTPKGTVRALTPIRVSISTSITTATSSPTGR